MSSLTVCTIDGKPAGTFDVEDGLLVLDRGQFAVLQAVTAHRAATRAGTASTLKKGEVAGSNKKPWRQKGTGQARAGYRQSPVWRGGGVIFGPKPRDYRQSLPKKMGRLAFCRALSDRIAGQAVKVVESLTLAEPKTKAFVAMMKALGVAAPVLFVIEAMDRNLARASRNLPGVALAEARNLSTYEVLRYPVLVASRPAMDVLKERLKKGRTGKAA